MREILFRGKDEGIKKWVQGYYLKGATRHCITYSLANYPRYDVIPETIGQYIGLTDKNGIKIFEGDIVLWCGIKGTVVWEGHKFYIKSNLLWDFSHDDCIEVIGNIHDNPELLQS